MSKTSELLYSLPSRLETTIIGMLTSRYIDEAAVDRTYSSNISLINWAWKVSVVVYIGCRKSIKDSQLEDEIPLINTGTYYLHSMTFKYQATLKKTGSSAGTGPIGRHTALFTYLLTYLPTYLPTDLTSRPAIPSYTCCISCIICCCLLCEMRNFFCHHDFSCITEMKLLSM